MKISELSRRSGVPLPTVKFYLREKLLPPGAASGPNQAEYGEAHLRRLALIRTLKDVGGLSIAALKRVIAIVEAPGAAVGQALEAGMDALGDRPRPEPATEAEAEARARAEGELLAYFSAQGWAPRPDSGAFQALADALAGVREVLDPGFSAADLAPYLRAAEGLAREELPRAAAQMRSDATEALQSAIANTVLFEPVLLSLRRLALEHLAEHLLEDHS